MTPGGTLTHYDVLDLAPDASPQEVREAYLRVKGTYSKDSAALYTLIDPDEREEMLHQVEEAYQTLSDLQKRKQYDQLHGLLLEEPSVSPTSGAFEVISGESQEPEQTLVSPNTDFEPNAASSSVSGIFEMSSIPIPTSFIPTSVPNFASPPPFGNEPEAKAQRSKNTTILSSSPTLEPWLAREVDVEVIWRGSFLKKIREAYRLSLEEVSGDTKISKTYIIAVEEENFVKLPAAVFVRGFVHQIAKMLKLPSPEKVAAAYLKRFREAQPEKY